MINTKDLINAHKELEKAKYPNSYDSGSAYAYLCGLLTACISLGKTKEEVQSDLDEYTEELRKELSEFKNSVSA